MFSRVVSAARGLLAGQESTASPQDQELEFESEPESQREQPVTDQAMVAATRSSTFSRPENVESVITADTTESPVVNGNSKAKGKRKSASSTASDVADSRTNKRRKGPVNGDAGVEKDGQSDTAPDALNSRRFRTLQSVEIVSQRPHTEQAPPCGERYEYSSEPVEEGVPLGNADSEPISGPAHVRFGSEIPESNAEEKESDAGGDEEEENHAPNGHRGALSEEESDDEAPEAVSNIAQLQELKDAERKRDEARKRHNQAKKDKRKEHEQRLKAQAASKPSSLLSPTVVTSDPQKPKHDELQSESSVTLQGSEVRTTKPLATHDLPALLPDEILNAEPSIRPPTPPRETGKEEAKKTPLNNKLRFLDTVHKPPKDVVAGGARVRVLDGSMKSNSKTGSNPSLPPKLSKGSRSVRDNWVTGNRNKDVSNGLRRTTGGTSSFVRR